MQASLEISMYPLNQEYKQPIIGFIKRLRSYEGLSVHSNGMSTQIFGEYDLLMRCVQDEVKKTFGEHPKVVMVMKLFNADLSELPQIS